MHSASGKTKRKLQDMWDSDILTGFPVLSQVYVGHDYTHVYMGERVPH